jgi:fructose-bisphosphate aldolase class 1
VNEIEPKVMIAILLSGNKKEYDKGIENVNNTNGTQRNTWSAIVSFCCSVFIVF